MITVGKKGDDGTGKLVDDEGNINTEDKLALNVDFSFRLYHSKAYHTVFDLVRKSGCCQSNCFKLWLFVRKRSDVLMLSPETDFYLFRFATKCRPDDFLYIAISVALMKYSSVMLLLQGT